MSPIAADSLGRVLSADPAGPWPTRFRSTPLTSAGLETLIEAAEALLFDWDGTLANSAPLYVRAWAAALATSGATMDAEWYQARHGLSEQALITAFEAETGLVVDRRRVVDTVRKTYLADLEMLEEIEAVTAFARRRLGQRPMAIASGGPAALVGPSLRALGLEDLFDAIVTVDDVARPKPSPDLFEEAARRLGVGPGRCLAFEDSETGVAAALAAGCEVVIVPELVVLAASAI